MQKYYPEGFFEENRLTPFFNTEAQLFDAMQQGKTLEARAIVCDGEHNLIVDLGCMKGIIPRVECAIGILEGFTKDIAIISRVNKPVCFKITAIKTNEKFKSYAILSRKLVQLECQEKYLDNLLQGDIICGKITHMESFGCFVDIGCGIISLLPIDAISISRISHPHDRFVVGQNINAIVKTIGIDKRICLSHKELLGTWQQNVANFKNGETVSGIIRSVESYGIFVELTPNLAGLAELKEGVKLSQHASVYIKNIIEDRMKIKLIIVDSFDAPYQNNNIEYFIEQGHMNYFKYSPENCQKIIETNFCDIQ
ncbi:MAG: S1 RNA-binding domain-containing protein [Oscillospiraceae bacterium]